MTVLVLLAGAGLTAAVLWRWESARVYVRFVGWTCLAIFAIACLIGLNVGGTLGLLVAAVMGLAIACLLFPVILLFLGFVSLLARAVNRLVHRADI